MTLAAWCLLAAAVFALLAIIVASQCLGGATPAVPPPLPAPEPEPPVALPAPVARTAPPPPPPAPPPPARITIRLVSGSGRRSLGSVTMDPRFRRPLLRQRTKDGLLSVFTADRQTPDGTWIYRRVGVEREG